MRDFATKFMVCMSLAATVGVGACGGGSKETPDGGPMEDAGPTENDNCPGQDWIDECAGVTPRIEVTVKDSAGAPVPNVLVYQFAVALDKSKQDAVAYPSVDGTNRRISYDACTNDTGKATICGFDPAATYPISLYDVVALKSGMTRGGTDDLTLDATEVKQVDIVINENPDATDEKLMVLSPQFLHRELSLLHRENFKYVTPSIGKVVDTLVPDINNPLRDFDTLYIGQDAGIWQSFGELLLTDKNAKLMAWIEAGGLLFFAQQNDANWATETGCPDTATACPADVLPAPYKFKFLLENTSCNDYKFGSVQDSSHTTVQGVTFSDWEYYESKAPPPNNALTWIDFDTVDGTTMDTSVWNVIVAASSDQDEADAKTTTCTTNAQYAVLNGNPVAAEADMGDGKIFVGQFGYEQGSQGDLTGGATEPNAVTLKNDVMTYLRAWQK